MLLHAENDLILRNFNFGEKKLVQKNLLENLWYSCREIDVYKRLKV